MADGNEAAAGRYLDHARLLFSEHAGPAPETVGCMHRCAAVQARGQLAETVGELADIGDRFPMPRPYWLAVRQAAVCLRLDAAIAGIDRRLRSR
jgi:hypothetical protein